MTMLKGTTRNWSGGAVMLMNPTGRAAAISEPTIPRITITTARAAPTRPSWRCTATRPAGHQRRLRQQQQEPGREGDAVDVEKGLGWAVHPGPFRVPRPEEEGPRETEHDRDRDRDRQTEVDTSLGGPAVPRAQGASGRGEGRAEGQRLTHERSGL